ncbi:MAG: hypothetical protein HQL31_13055 [Planctomycetes bacterium]|nr:hypothetical protein [Planctomycetota bacterium]
MAKLASLVMVGRNLKELGYTQEIIPRDVCVKECVLPFARFKGSDIILSPEMRSTGEVMGIADNFDMAFAKAQIAAGSPLPSQGNAFVSINEKDRKMLLNCITELSDMGFQLLTTGGTGKFLWAHGIESTILKKVQDGSPNAFDLMDEDRVQIVIMTPSRKGQGVESEIRQKAILRDIPVYTTVSGAIAAARAIRCCMNHEGSIVSLQER